MKQTKLISALHVLNKKEINCFKEFIISPFFNKNEKVRKLVAYLLPHWPDFEHERIDKKVVYKEIYGPERYDDIRINNLISYTYKLLESCLSIQQYINSSQFDATLAQELNSRKLHKHFERAIARTKGNLTNRKDKNSAFYYQKFQMADLEDNHFIETGARKFNESLQEKADNLDVFYLVEKLKVTTEMLNRQNILKQEYTIRLTDQLEQTIYNQWDYYKHFTPLYLYYKAYKTLSEPADESHFHDFVRSLNNKSVEVSDGLARELYGLAQNYCIRQINAGNTTYSGHILNLYKDMIGNTLILDNGFISEWDFKNIVTIGIRQKEFDWTEQFIEEHTNYLPEETKTNAYTYNLAMLYFGMKAYDKSLRLLIDVEFTDVFYHLGAKTTLLKIYYAEMETEAFMNLYDTFKTYLHRNKLISETQKLSYNNMLRCAKKAFTLRINAGYFSDTKYQHQLNRLKYMLGHSGQIANTNWLNEIAAALEREPVQ